MLIDVEIAESWIGRELRDAVRADGLDVHYQPIRAADDLRLIAYEALLRWPHPARGSIPPACFIPVAERSDLIDVIGDWLLARACADAAALGSRYVGVNVSAAQLRRADFAQRFLAILDRHGASAGQITVEVTETVALRSVGAELDNIHALRAMGCWVAIDDFGTGHAGPDYLDRFPFNVLKIDKAFVQRLDRSRPTRDFVSSLCRVCERRDVVVVAEGVETDAQLAILRDLGCPRLQGYLLGRPARVDAWAAVRAPGSTERRAGE